MKLILDTGPALLYVIGTFDPAMIKRHKRLEAYSRSDFQLLLRIASRFDAVLMTSNVLTEVSNLSVFGVGDTVGERIRRALYEAFEDAEERHVPLRSVGNHAGYARLGLTDAALLQICGADRLLVTSDTMLYVAASSAGYGVLNFEYERSRV